MPSIMDGHPSRPIPPGETRAVTFPIVRRAGTYRFHSHPHMRTGAQVVLGLAGMIVVRDPPKDSFGLPDGAPIVAIGSGGGLLEAPVVQPYLMLAPGERAEVSGDFTGRPLGSVVSLRSLALSCGGSG